LGIRRRKEEEEGENVIMKGSLFLLLTKHYSVRKSRRIRWMGHVVYLGKKTYSYRDFGGETYSRQAS
jgi:hypothetical protein